VRVAEESNEVDQHLTPVARAERRVPRRKFRIFRSSEPLDGRRVSGLLSHYRARLVAQAVRAACEDRGRHELWLLERERQLQHGSRAVAAEGGSPHVQVSA